MNSNDLEKQVIVSPEHKDHVHLEWTTLILLVGLMGSTIDTLTKVGDLFPQPSPLLFLNGISHVRNSNEL